MSYKGSFCDVLQSDKGVPTIPGKSKGDSKDKERKHRKHKDKDREKDKEHKKRKHRHKDRSKDKDREKKDRSGHHDSSGDHSKKHHEKVFFLCLVCFCKLLFLFCLSCYSWICFLNIYVVEEET